MDAGGVKDQLRRMRHAQLARLDLSLLDEEPDDASDHRDRGGGAAAAAAAAVSATADDGDDSDCYATQRVFAGPALPLTGAGLYKLPTPHTNPFVHHHHAPSATAEPRQALERQRATPPTVPRFVSPPTVPQCVTTPRMPPSTPSTASCTARPLALGVPHKKARFDTDRFGVKRGRLGGAALGAAAVPPSRIPIAGAHSTQMAATQHVSRYVHDYEQLGVIASGNFGLVTRCRQRVDGCEYAIKRVGGDSGRGRGGGGAMSKKVAHQEIFALAALETCPNVVRYYQSWIEDGSIYIQLELCETSLHNQIEDRRGVFFPEQRVVDVLRQVNAGLHHLHSNGLVHLDVKPENILVRAGVYKIGDLGMVTQVRGPGSHDDRHEGDVRFLAREVLRDNREQLQKADVFSLGASVYSMMICSDLPRNGPEWNAIRDGRLRVRVPAAANGKRKARVCPMAGGGGSSGDSSGGGSGGGGGGGAGDLFSSPPAFLARIAETADTEAGADRAPAQSSDDDTGEIDRLHLPSPVVVRRGGHRASAPGADSSDDEEDQEEEEEEEEEEDQKGDQEEDQSTWPEFGRPFVDLVRSLMHPAPEQRPTTAVVLKSDLLASGVESKLRRERAVNKMLSTQLKSQHEQQRQHHHHSLLHHHRHAFLHAAAGGMGGIGAGTKRKLGGGFPSRAPLRRSMTS